MAPTDSFTVGVEEEFHLVGIDTMELAAAGPDVVEAAQAELGHQVVGELSLTQVETRTAVCTDLGDLAAELRRLRRAVAGHAASAGLRLAASGSHPSAPEGGLGFTAEPRYLDLAERYRYLAAENLIAACHVHVGVADVDEAVAVVDRLRPWLPVLLALGANSPYWHGLDTGYASYRTMVFDKWPTAGPPPLLGTRPAYDAEVAGLQAARAIASPTQLYWDARPSSRFPTVEIRVADTGQTVEDVVAMAGLTRALVQTCHREAGRGRPFPRPSATQLRAARWRAARYGLEDDLVDPMGDGLVPARQAVEKAVDFARQGGDDPVADGVEDLLVRGTGAVRQRAAHRSGGSLAAVVESVLVEPG